MRSSNGQRSRPGLHSRRALLSTVYDGRPLACAPRRNDEFFATGRDGGQCDAVVVQPEPVRLDPDGSGIDLAVAQLIRRIASRRVSGRAVHGDTGISPEILRAHGPGHHAQVDFPVVGEVDLDAADARRTVAIVACFRTAKFSLTVCPGPGSSATNCAHELTVPTVAGIAATSPGWGLSIGGFEILGIHGFLWPW